MQFKSDFAEDVRCAAWRLGQYMLTLSWDDMKTSVEAARLYYGDGDRLMADLTPEERRLGSNLQIRLPDDPATALAVLHLLPRIIGWAGEGVFNLGGWHTCSFAQHEPYAGTSGTPTETPRIRAVK